MNDSTFDSPRPAARRRGFARVGSLLAAALLAGGAAVFAAAPAQAVPVNQETVDGVLYTFDLADPGAGATAISYDNSFGSVVTIPDSVAIPAGGPGYPVTGIAPGAFASMGLTTLTLPDGIETIGDSAFLDNELTAITLPSALTELTDASFAFNQITHVDIPETVGRIGEAVFAYNRLTSLTIPDSVTSIGHSAFLMNSLTSVSLGSGLTTIGPAAFSWNVLESVIIPASVHTIGGWAFGQNSVFFLTRPDPNTFDPDTVLAQHSTLTSVTFEGRPPAAFVPTADTNVNPDSQLDTEDMPSLGAGFGLTVRYPLGFEAADPAAGFTTPSWRGYASAPYLVVDFQIAGHGAQPALQRVAVGATATQPADPTANGWTFTGWFTDATLQTPFDFATAITANTVLHAGWTPVPVAPTTATLSFDLHGHGTPITAQTVTVGGTATKPAAPTAAGWAFTGWYTDATLKTPFDFATAITADTVLHAGWTRNAITPPGPEEPGTVTPPATTPTAPSAPLATTGAANPGGAVLASLSVLVLGAGLVGAGVLGARARGRRG